MDAAKIRDDRRSGPHPVGRFKAAFCVALGYSPADWKLHAADLRSHAMAHDAAAFERSEYGQK